MLFVWFVVDVVFVLFFFVFFLFCFFAFCFVLFFADVSFCMLNITGYILFRH